MKTMISVLALVCILVGLVSMITPIPGGIVLVAVGLTMLICINPSAQYCLMWIRSRVSWVNKLMYWLEAKVGNRISVVGVAFAKTHPPEANLILSHRAFIQAWAKNKQDA